MEYVFLNNNNNKNTTLLWILQESLSDHYFKKGTEGSESETNQASLYWKASRFFI